MPTRGPEQDTTTATNPAGTADTDASRRSPGRRSAAGGAPAVPSTSPAFSASVAF
ncbi:hypothetical protein [Streptomyces sp. I05A-00742]|uniref:hypothetical protein n=1 Tax=Streptomyces sp. I05A-00742 TaxID=2732853 RepID=UPI001487EAFB|nr:hypothetical protein [Streptomyces sp. I05A-00742]